MSRAIGVFDSGVGGLTVAREIMRQLPNETIYYFGDVKNCPYGDKKREEIIENTEKAVKFLINQGVKMIVLACNTATAAALDYLQQKYDIPIIGVVQPGARRAIQATENNKVLVLGTKFTANSKVYDREVEHINSNIIVYDKACPAFCPFIEAEGNLIPDATKKLLEETLTETKNLDMDTVVLGCTHYPILKKDIEKYYGDKIKVISSGREAAREVSTVLTYEKLHQKKLNKKEHKFFISGYSDNFDNIASKWLKKSIKAEIVEL
ncbi:glutamate racemase [Gemella cuniculi]|uniref:glutamate racemase n=1 Tax=Gemella cuniculi TaxID=150240 RepID=UPI000413B547|nr:glutamate racemase [Gemella cuniculi]